MRFWQGFRGLFKRSSHSRTTVIGFSNQTQTRQASKPVKKTGFRLLGRPKMNARVAERTRISLECAPYDEAHSLTNIPSNHGGDRY